MATSQTAASLSDQDVLDLEAQRIAAMVRVDVPTLEALLADDLSYVHSGGRIDTKATFLALIAESEYEGVDYKQAEVRPAGGGWLVRGIAQIRLKRASGERLSYPVFFLDVWAQRDGRWQLVAWQATRAPEE